MTNVDLKVTGDKLTIIVDLKESHGSSKSGKTQVIATTHGFHWFDSGDKSVGVSLNVNRK